MFVKNIDECTSFTANDGCSIQEWLHPDKDAIELPYSVASAVVSKGQQSYKHKLKQEEVYLILAGKGLMHIDDEAREVNVGDAVVIPANSIQWIENKGNTDLKFLAIVSPPWRAEDDIRISN